MNPLFISLSAGLVTGIVYGLLFLLQKKYELKEDLTKRKRIIFAIASTTPRLVLLSIVLYYLLRSTTIEPILFVASFLISFWFIIVLYKRTL